MDNQIYYLAPFEKDFPFNVIPDFLKNTTALEITENNFRFHKIPNFNKNIPTLLFSGTK